MEAANLFCGDDDPSKSKHLTLTEIALPVLEENYQDHHPGGSLVGIEVNVGVSKLSSTFKLGGWDPDMLNEFGLGRVGTKNFTSYGVVRNKRTGGLIEVKAVMAGRLGKIEGEAFTRGEFQSHDYAINGILHYELYWQGREKFYWDFFSSDYRINGRDENAQEKRILRLI
ncbi:phage major tail tube protein [Paracoccus sp. DMF-8]|uniref:phage major tail tube protein n=1 Tax=Paracoccus sp. DMF-8 TaxID=3019445 RepID=UPI0023E868DA|nr:phage major tail tube protein [Paracoccus sp. DMF-8]MDF3606568.1 phage major tail tube protein [Paracoccus sp. DMF-8]